MPVTKRTRFEVFKRDNFTCRYCGKSSPQVILEVDHIIATAKGGTDDPMNLATSCWDCNRGKSDVPLSDVMTGEDPHDAAILLLEKRRQLEEYNVVLSADYQSRFEDFKLLACLWCQDLSMADETWILNSLKVVPREIIREAMELAISRNKTRNLAYVNAVVRNWREEHEADEDV